MVCVHCKVISYIKIGILFPINGSFMNHNLRKTAGYLSIIALLNGSCATLYAQKGGLETDDQAPRHPIQQQRKTVTWEEWGQQRATSLADRIASWIPQGVKSYLNTLGEDIIPLVNGKTPMEMDYSDPLSQMGFVKLSGPIAKALKSYREELSTTKVQDREENLNPLKHLSFYNEDELTEPFNSSLPPEPQDPEDDVSALDAVALGIAASLYKGMKFVVNNPGKALSMGLMEQAGVAAAMSAFSGPTARRSSFECEKPHHFEKRAIGDEFQINQNITGVQWPPYIAPLLNENFFVTLEGDKTGNAD